MMHRTSAVACVCVALSSVLAAQLPTLPEQAAQSGGKPVQRGIYREPPALSLEQLTARAELIVVARLTPLRSYLSESQNEVLTDYRVNARQVVTDRSPGRAQHGATPTVVVTLLGGSVTSEGTSIGFTAHHYRPIDTNGHFLMFLEPSKTGQERYLPVGESAGLFEVVGNESVRTMMKGGPPTTKEIEAHSLRTLAVKIRSLSRSRPTPRGR